MTDPPTLKPNNKASDIVIWVWVCLMAGTLLHMFLPIQGPHGTTIEGILIGGAIAWRTVGILNDKKEPEE